MCAAVGNGAYPNPVVTMMRTHVRPCLPHMALTGEPRSEIRWQKMSIDVGACLQIDSNVQHRFGSLIRHRYMTSLPTTYAKMAQRDAACAGARLPPIAALVLLGVVRDELPDCVNDGAGADDRIPPGGEDVDAADVLLEALDAPDDDTPEGRMPVGIPVDEPAADVRDLRVGIGRDVTLPLPVMGWKELIGSTVIGAPVAVTCPPTSGTSTTASIGRTASLPNASRMLSSEK